MGAALLFDMDGCLVDSFPAIARCWAQTLPEFGLESPTPEQVRPDVGPPVDVVARRFAPQADEQTVAAIVAAYRRCSVGATDVTVFPGIPELLSELNEQGLELAIATSKSIEVAESQLDRLDLRRWFSFVEGTPVDELGADKATVVGRALDRLAPIRPTALIGDREHDVHGAHAHGIRAVGALWGYGSSHELERAGADALAQTPADVSAVIRAMA
jgi:phosphoglycolate phosphatase